MTSSTRIKTFAVLGNHLPRQCGAVVFSQGTPASSVFYPRAIFFVRSLDEVFFDPDVSRQHVRDEDQLFNSSERPARVSMRVN